MCTATADQYDRLKINKNVNNIIIYMILWCHWLGELQKLTLQIARGTGLTCRLQ